MFAAESRPIPLAATAAKPNVFFSKRSVSNLDAAPDASRLQPTEPGRQEQNKRVLAKGTDQKHFERPEDSAHKPQVARKLEFEQHFCERRLFRLQDRRLCQRPSILWGVLSRAAEPSRKAHEFRCRFRVLLQKLTILRYKNSQSRAP